MLMTTRRHWLLPVLLVASISAPAWADDNLGRIEFQTEVSRVLPNDLMRATLFIEANDKEAGQLSRTLTLAMNDALRKSKAYSAVNVASGNQQNWPVYGKNNHLDSWRGRAELNIESRDFKEAGELIAKLQETLQLQGVSFAVADETRQANEQAMTTEAIAAFKNKAEVVRKAWGASSYKLVQMSLNSNGGNPVYRPMAMMKVAMASDAMPTPEVAGGESRLNVSVNGTIQVAPL